MSKSTAWQKVPKDRAKNEAFRAVLLELAEEFVEVQELLREICAKDCLFWLNTFCFVNEPRPSEDHGFGRIPFITWPSQDEFVQVMEENWGTNDVLCDKARGEGASWLVLLKILHSWIFFPKDHLFIAGLASKDEESVDDPDDPDSLMWKLDWELEQLPSWMVPKFTRTRNNHSLVNDERGHSIKGYAATSNLGTGGRKFCWLWDEMSKFGKGKDRAALNSTEPTTNCRIMVSTHEGTTNEYFRMIKNPGRTPLVVMSWEKNPHRNHQMFHLVDNAPMLIDPSQEDQAWRDFVSTWRDTYEDLQELGFEFTEDKLLSPWYISRCLRSGSTPQSIAQEYDRNPEGTEQGYFSAVKIEKLRKRTVQPPKHRGFFQFDPETLEGQFVPASDGKVLVWCDLAFGQPVLEGEACFGADISSGLGGSKTSNSVLIGFDRNSGQQLMEFSINTLLPHDFARYCLAIATWFDNGMMNWETNGTNGVAFTQTVKAMRYGNVYYREVMDAKSKKKTKKMGWGSRTRTKDELLGGVAGGGFRSAVYDGKAIIRSEYLLEETGQYIYDDAGHVVHAGSLVDDPANQNEAHGDRVIAAAVAWLTVTDRPAPKSAKAGEEKKPRKGYPVGSMGHILEMMDREDARRASQRNEFVFS